MIPRSFLLRICLCHGLNDYQKVNVYNFPDDGDGRRRESRPDSILTMENVMHSRFLLLHATRPADISTQSIRYAADETKGLLLCLMCTTRDSLCVCFGKTSSSPASLGDRVMLPGEEHVSASFLLEIAMPARDSGPRFAEDFTA